MKPLRSYVILKSLNYKNSVETLLLHSPSKVSVDRKAEDVIKYKYIAGI